jgi:tRNA-specific 2-thiouridylase
MAHIVVALSGGVDSAVTAALLKEQGHAVEAAHMKTGFHGKSGIEGTCHNAERIAAFLSIPFHVWDLSSDFKTEVVNYFIHSYLQGRTPNPCVVCNPRIKFGPFLERARGLGADFLATGHYARKERVDATGRYLLKKGVDPQKDQSYFLHRMTQAQLNLVLFPLGEMLKEEVRKIAQALGLSRLAAPESQEFCFLGRRSYKEFISEEMGLYMGEGEIVDARGKVLGRHQGMHRFTIGQRHGLNLPSTEPYYVLEIIPSQNRVVIGRRQELFSIGAVVDQVLWMVEPKAKAFSASTRIRFRHKEAPSTIHILDDSKVRVVFDNKVQAVTPGQAAVFYDHDVVLGGGWIREAIKE